MQLWLPTASPPQQSRCSEIDSPEREIWPKFSLADKRKNENEKDLCNLDDLADFKENQ
jgi:hypothetical protein